MNRGKIDSQASTEIVAEIADTSRRRQCLMCHDHFASAWPGERICAKCKTGSAWRRGTEWAPAKTRS